MLIYVGVKVAIYQINILPALRGSSPMGATFIGRMVIHRQHFLVYIYNSLYKNQS